MCQAEKNNENNEKGYKKYKILLLVDVFKQVFVSIITKLHWFSTENKYLFQI